jgi:hypothetical protein
MPKSIKQLYIELLVKHSLYEELARFKEQKKLPRDQRMSNREIYLRNKELLK